jgi:excisionase family DNA binding protein
MTWEALLTADEDAELLRVSRWRVYKLIKERQLVSVKVRSGRRIVPESVDAYIAALIDGVA